MSEALSFGDAIQQGIEVSAEAPPSNVWSPSVAGEWCIGEIASIQHRESQGRKPGDPPRQFRMLQIWGKRGAGGPRHIPRTPEGIWGEGAELIPMADGRSGVQRCLSQPVDGTDRRGAQEGDFVLLRCLGREGNAYRYGGYLARLSDEEGRHVTHVPNHVHEEIAAQEQRFAERGSPAMSAAPDDDDGVQDPKGLLS